MDAFIGYAQIIVPIFAVIFAWRYVVLIARRASLIMRLRRYRGLIKWKRRFASVFVHDGGTDVIVHAADGDVEVAISQLRTDADVTSSHPTARSRSSRRAARCSA